jgi:O-acetyl-ADP-ribose deacetylase (regulator of RNase III)
MALVWMPPGSDLLASTAEFLVCPVNTEGAMGAGLAKAFRDRFPGLETTYRQGLRDGMLGIGAGYLVWITPIPEGRRALGVWLMPTKRSWKGPSLRSYVKDGLDELAVALKYWRPPILSVAVPALGCGLGRLPFREVRPLIEAFASAVPAVTVEAYGPR